MLLKTASIIAVLFGVATVLSGGRALFGDAAAQAAAGNAVPFVLWFNFIVGGFYIIAGAGLFFGRRWAVWLAIVLALSTLVIFAAFGVHIWLGGAFEMRTLGAMILRSLVWIGIATIGFRICFSAREP